MKRYDTTAAPGEVAEFGLGCNGVVDVLLERVPDPRSSAYLELLSSCFKGARR